MEKTKKYWLGSIGKTDDFDDDIVDYIIDGKTKMGLWALMTQASYIKYGVRIGQMYEKQPDGKWLKIN